VFADSIRASSPQPTASTGRTEDCTRPKPTYQFSPCNAGAIHRGHVAVANVSFWPQCWHAWRTPRLSCLRSRADLLFTSGNGHTLRL